MFCKFIRLICSITTIFVTLPTVCKANPEIEPIKFGAVLMLTGDQAVYGEAMREGIQIALDETNTAGGIAGRPVEVLFEDSQLNPRTAHTVATKLISNDKIVAALDASFIEVMANGSVFEKNRVPVITLWDSSKEIENLGDYVFAIGVWTASSAEKSANFSRSTLEASTAVVINLQAEWPEAVGGQFKDDFESLGGKVLDKISVPPSTTDFRTVFARVRSAKPDVVYTPITENVVTFYKQLRESGLPSKVVTSDIIADEHIKVSPQIFEGIYQTQPVDPHSESFLKVAAAYRVKFKKDIKLPLFVAWGYDGLKLLTRAAEVSGTSSENIKTHLYTIEDYPGASGTITFNARGSSPIRVEMFRVMKSKFEPVG